MLIPASSSLCGLITGDPPRGGRVTQPPINLTDFNMTLNISMHRLGSVVFSSTDQRDRNTQECRKTLLTTDQL